MSHRMYRSYQALILMGLGLFLGLKLVNGTLTWYINQRFIPLTLLAIVLFFILAGSLTQRRNGDDQRGHDHEHDHEHHTHEHNHASGGNLVFLLIPLAIGLLIPARPLDSTALSTRGFTTSSALVSSGGAAIFETDAEQRTILDWIKVFNYESNLEPYLGQKAAVIGFVYHDEKLAEGQFYVSRFVVSCCAADGFALAMLVEWPEAASLEQDAWVLVRGPVTSAQTETHTIPVIQAETVEIVPVPDQPYLYP
ncbi:MAG: TIGR03943 family putative permease subunit [Chloroflexota bacterium]